MYCQKIVGDQEFSIEEWNRQYALCNKLGIPFPDADRVQCKTQCDACRLIVTKRQNRTRELINKGK